MMIVRRHSLTIIALSVAASATACAGPAQVSDHFATLATPPASVGTCLASPVPVVRDSSTGELRAHHLVMSAIEPGRRREMTVYTDSAGQARRYAEWNHRMTDTSASTGESVIAVLMPDGRVGGMLMRLAVSMDSPVGGATSAAELRARRDSATGSPERAALTEDQQAQVREIAAWLARRCPA